MKHLLVLFLLILMRVSAFAQSTIMDGNNLDDSCLYQKQVEEHGQYTSEEFGKTMFCIGYIRGVVDDIWMQHNAPEGLGLKSGGPQKVCIKDISNSQMVKVISKYLRDNPAKLQLPAGYVIRLALQDAFPCK